jgi:hypothetical protein
MISSAGMVSAFLQPRNVMGEFWEKSKNTLHCIKSIKYNSHIQHLFLNAMLLSVISTAEISLMKKAAIGRSQAPTL